MEAGRIVTGETIHPSNCPICGLDNDCGNLSGKPRGTCWCSRESFPDEIFDLVPSHQMNQSCICRDCLSAFKNGRQDEKAE
ncbi:cysteine-rich CWC family protein [Desmospora profundinema]|uniref:cysteine-rich CWC family protein n=1 Tax=Desmospora profundinema TaxID=1571184 RepID=UPI00286D2854|nr:cysteine-rich CWC family protein [Desmospora profundinema]